MFELTRDFAFRAVPDVCTNRHLPGGDFCVRITLRRAQTDCMVMPLSELSMAVCALLDSLHKQDPCKVMDLPPLKDLLWPSLELMAHWIYHRLRPELPDLWSVSVSRDDSWQERATYWSHNKQPISLTAKGAPDVVAEWMKSNLPVTCADCGSRFSMVKDLPLQCPGCHSTSVLVG